jgi:hypothetical protein
MRVARMGYAQRVVKKDKEGRVTQSFMRVRVEVSDPIISALLPEPYTGLKSLTKKVDNEREHVEWIARFLGMIAEARSVWKGTSRPVNYIRVPLAPLTTHVVTHRIIHGGFGSHFVPEDQARSILAEQQERQHQRSETVPEPTPWPAPPPVAAPISSAAAPNGPVTFATVVALWARERQIPPPGERQMLSKANRFATFLGHDDMGRVTPCDVIRYKEEMLKPETGFAHRNVKNHWADLRTLFKFAAENRGIADPMLGLTFKYRNKGVKFSGVTVTRCKDGSHFGSASKCSSPARL